MYLEELEQFKEQVGWAGDGKYCFETEHITGDSLFSEDDLRASYRSQEDVADVVKTFYGLLKAVYNTTPGEPGPVLIEDGEPYGLGCDIAVDKQFDRDDFDTMVDELYDDLKGYTWSDVTDRIQEIEDMESAADALRIGAQLAGLGIMKQSRRVVAPTMTRSFNADKNTFGVRFLETEDANYININAAPTNTERLFTEAKAITTYLDEELTE